MTVLTSEMCVWAFCSPAIIISATFRSEVILFFVMKLLATFFLATFITANAECDDEPSLCIPTGESCMNSDKECCGEDECYGFPFFKRCQPVPECIPEWHDCDNGVSECCDDSLACVENKHGQKVCMEETITPRTAPIPPPKNHNVTKIPGEPVNFNYACSTGDPHINTFDGLRWDCQGHGEFIAYKSQITQREIQLRYTQMTSKTWSVGEGVVIQDEGNTPRVQITMPVISQKDGGGVSQLLGPKDKNCQVQFFVNGVQRDLYSGSGDDGVEITVEHGRSIHIKYVESGMTATVTYGFWKQCFLQTCFAIPDTDPGLGLLGTADGDVSNDWTKPDGTVVPIDASTNNRVRTKTAYDYCTQNWCMRDPEQSLFTYNQAGKTFEDFQMCDLPQDTYIIDDLEDEITPEIEEFCGTDVDCIVDAVTGGGIEAAQDAKILRTGFLSQSCNKEGGECADSNCCTGYECVTLGGLTTPTCHANPEEPACYPEAATCSATRPCCEGTTCEEHNNGQFYCKEIPPECTEERGACSADSDCCGEQKCVGPADNKRCLTLEQIGDNLFLPEMEQCGYANQEYNCKGSASCVRSAEGSRCTTLPQCWDEPYRPCGDHLGYPDCCEASGNVCQMKDNIKQCVPIPQCSAKLFPCEGEFGSLRVPCCEGLTCQWRGNIKLCVAPPAPCHRTASTGEDHIDQDCTAEEPVCFNDDGTQPAVDEAGKICGFCMNDKEDNGIDIGCDDEAPRCIAGDNTEVDIGAQGSKCAEPIALPFCENENDETPRTGCSAEKPVCFQGGHVAAARGESGEWCGVCLNDKDGDDKDYGCTDAEPRCVSADGHETPKNKEGYKCVPPLPVLCRNTGTDGINENCEADLPVCAKQNSRTPGINEPGDFCARCWKQDTPDDVADFGCTAATPLCVDDDNKSPGVGFVGSKCVELHTEPKCKNDAPGPWRDEGCTDTQKPQCVHADGRTTAWEQSGDKCAKCVNDSDGGKDTGCYRREKHCVLDDGSTPAVGYAGTKCSA